MVAGRSGRWRRQRRIPDGDHSRRWRGPAGWPIHRRIGPANCSYTRDQRARRVHSVEPREGGGDRCRDRPQPRSGVAPKARFRESHEQHLTKKAADQGSAAFTVLGLGSAACACSATLKCPSFVFTHAAPPNTGVLSGLQGPLKAGVYNGAAAADAFGFLDLQKCWSRVAYWEEELRVLFEAGCAITPIHADQSLHS